jgi:V8-like Glu-specific endopeptidase
MSHNIGRVVTIAPQRIGQDTGQPPNAGPNWEFAFTPQAALIGGPPRFVILHLTALALTGASKVEVELGYGKDVFTSATGSEAWSRPVDPKLGPIIVRFIGASGGATLAQYGSGEPWFTDYEPIDEEFESTTNGDVFLHTDPYDEPTYQTWLKCGGVFNWSNVAAAPAGSIQAETAKAVGMIVNYHRHGTETLVSSCSVTLIDTNLILTARHCVAEDDQLEARSGSVTFDYQTDQFGGKPGSYAPRFHKVRQIRAMGVGNNIGDDWAVLEIDPPPVGITPRPLRGSVPVNGESVFTVHHPNAAVKKYQNGAMSGTSVGSVSFFDYAGGSSGSSLFDAAGQVLGAALAVPGGFGAFQCNVGYSPASAVLTALANPPVPVVPVDVMLVMDRSGSMSQLGTSGAGRTKLVEAKEAASLFVQLVRLNAGDRMGMVSFSTTATVPQPDTAPGNVNNGKKNQLVGPNPPYTGGSVGDLIANGWTSIGDGLQKAMTALNGLSATTNQKAILLMTDGKQNQPPLVEGVEGSLGSTRMLVVGFGNEAQLDSALLNRLARDHAGLYTRANDGLILKKFFALAFGNIFEAGMLMDPEIVLQRGEHEGRELSFDVCDEDRITVVVGWDDPAADLEAVLDTPTGATLTAGGSVVVDTGPTWWFMKAPLPVNGAREGTWRVRIRRRSGQEDVGEPATDFVGESVAGAAGSVRAFVSIVADGGPRMQAVPQTRRLYTGDRFSPRVALRRLDGSAPHAEVKVAITGPGVALGSLVAEHGLVQGTVGDEPVDAFSATLQAIAAEAGGELPLHESTVEVALVDDGIHDGGAMDRDGIFGNPLDDLLKFEGTYQLHAAGSYGVACRGQREAMWSIHVEPGIDAGRTTVVVVGGVAGPGGIQTGVVRITPRDKYGNPLGPGRGDRFEVAPQPGSAVCGPVSDNGDGSYDVPVTWDPDVAVGGPGVVIVQPDRAPVPVAPPPTAAPWWCRYPWLPWLLVLIILVLLVVLILVLIS